MRALRYLSLALCCVFWGCREEDGQISAIPDAHSDSLPRIEMDVRTGEESDEDFADLLDGHSTFLRAVRLDRKDELREILADYPEAIEERGHMGRTALHIAVENNNLELAQLLLDADADPNAKRTERKDTPIFWANSPQMADLLLRAGADPGVRDFSHRLPIHWAAQFALPEMVSFWLNHGMDVNDTDDSNMTPLNWAVNEITETESLSCVKVLIQAGADVNAKGYFGRVPLRSVARLPDLEQKLLDGSLKYKPGVKETTLEILQLLLDSGADPKIADDKGVTPLEASDGEPKKIMEQWMKMHLKH